MARVVERPGREHNFRVARRSPRVEGFARNQTGDDGFFLRLLMRR